MPKKVAITPAIIQKRKVAAKKKPIQEPEPELNNEDLVESESETDKELEPIPEKPKLIRQKAQKPVEVEAEQDEDEDDEPAVPQHRGRPKATKKEPKAPSLWLTVLKENGFMCKGGSFKPTPKKGTPEYEAVRKIFDERKAAAAK